MTNPLKNKKLDFDNERMKPLPLSNDKQLTHLNSTIDIRIIQAFANETNAFTTSSQVSQIKVSLDL